MNLKDIESYLSDASNNFSARESEPYLNALAVLKEQAVKNNDQPLAKTIWCYETVLKIQDQYIIAYFQMKASEFYQAWCSLARVELGLHFLSKHFQDKNNEYYISFVEKHTLQYQLLYPYKIFLSPEILEIEKKCSICNKVVTPFNPCEHRTGEIYNGIKCARVVTKSEFLGTAFVENPVQKYSVPFIPDQNNGEPKDHYNYASVNYLIKRVRSPFHAWDVKHIMTRLPHSRYSHIGRNASCPCESGKKYKHCCLKEDGVLRPHEEFYFEILPPKHLLKIEYTMQT